MERMDALAKHMTQVDETIEQGITLRTFDVTAYAAFLAKALSTDAGRPVLSSMAIITMRGHLYAVTTDTHRLHCVKLGESEGLSLKCETALKLDLRMALKMRPKPSEKVYIDLDGATATLRIGTALTVPPVDDAGMYPNAERVIPDTFDWSRNDIRPVPWALNAGYLSDLQKMDLSGNGRAVCVNPGLDMERSQVQVTRPMVFTAGGIDFWNAPAFAVVMPMYATD